MGAAAGASAGLGAVGSILTGISGMETAKEQARVDQINARQAANNADVALDQAQLASQRDYQEGGARLGAQRAQMAANGVTLDSGSALDVQQATARNTGMNVGTDMYQGDLNAVNFRNQATSYNNAQRAADAQATNSMIGGGMGATGSLASSFSQFSDKWDDMRSDMDGDAFGGRTSSSWGSW